MCAYENADRKGAPPLDEQATTQADASIESDIPHGAEATEAARAPASTVDPDVEEARILAQLEALMRRYPERMARYLEEIYRVIEETRPASTERSLNSSQAAKRAGCTDTHLLRKLDRGQLGMRDAEGRPRFSEAECDAFRREVRKPGRPRKTARL